MSQWSLLQSAIAQVSVPAFLRSLFVQTFENLAYQLSPLRPTTGNLQYLGPYKGSDTTCLCNSVYYSLLSACAYCQGGSILPWVLLKIISFIVPQYPWFDPGGQIIPPIVQVSASQCKPSRSLISVIIFIFSSDTRNKSHLESRFQTMLIRMFRYSFHRRWIIKVIAKIFS